MTKIPFKLTIHRPAEGLDEGSDVSLTCICCKLLEHIVVGNMMEHLESNKILYDWQHGFRSKRSTETQPVTLVHKLCENLDNRKKLTLQSWT